VALGGVLSTLCILSLYLAVYLPTNRMFFYGISSIFSSIILVESGIKWAWTFYGATSMLAFLVIPNKIGLIPYLLFFGLYGIVKYGIEGIRNMIFEIILKGGFFIFTMAGTAVIVKELFVGDVYSKFPLYAVVVIGVIVFYIYDYAYTKFVIYYETNLRKRII